MNTRERYVALMNFEEVDRSLKWEFGYQAGAVRQWYAEGLPKSEGIPEDLGEDGAIWAESTGNPTGATFSNTTSRDVHDYFDLDPAIERVPLNVGAYPPFEERIVEQREGGYVKQDVDGCYNLYVTSNTAPPSFVDQPMRTRADWERYKEERLQPDIRGRLPDNWADLVQGYKTRDYPLALGQATGFYGTPRLLLGYERLLTMYYDDPGLMRDMNEYLADFWIALYDRVLHDVAIDAVFIWEDMAYKKGPTVSPAIFREFIMPGYQKLTSFLHENGVSVINVDTDGNVWKLIPLFIEAGVNVLYPFQADANDLFAVRKTFPKLGMIGGLEKRVLNEGKQAIDRELEAKVPALLDHGGYIPHIDHFAQHGMSLENFEYYRRKLNDLITTHARPR
jgi:hypothetical protein